MLGQQFQVCAVLHKPHLGEQAYDFCPHHIANWKDNRGLPLDTAAAGRTSRLRPIKLVGFVEKVYLCLPKINSRLRSALQVGSA